MTVNAHPLAWPTGWKRTDGGARTAARFGVRAYPGQSLRDATVNDGRMRVLEELQRMGVSRDDLVVSTNTPLRLDGTPRSDARAPDDPGVAVYWVDAGERRVIAVDRYTTVAGNLCAVAATLDAMRAIERHGGAVVLERAYTGFAALPAPTAARPWREVLGLPVDREVHLSEVEEAYRRLRSQHHPDKGGDPARFDEVERAYREAMAA